MSCHSEDFGAPRRARPDEARTVADLWSLSRRASIPDIPPPVHTDQDIREWFEHVVFASQDVWVIEASGHLVALMVLTLGWIEQLYVHPDWSDRGFGSRLLGVAKREFTSLDLWTFQSNAGARKFYERNGFFEVAQTEGDNEEHAPDVRYHWEFSDVEEERINE